MLAIEFDNITGCSRKWLACFIHATSYNHEKDLFWAYLNGIISARDLNEILHADEQSDGNFFNHHHSYLRDLIDPNWALDLGNTGYKFTR